MVRKSKLKLENLVSGIFGTGKEPTNVDEFKNKPFYCWDTEYLGKRDCCFNHMVGLPQDVKTFETRPLFPYQLEVFEAWQRYKHIWIKKATGLGISEFFIRLMLWLCVRDDEFRGARMCIITGPNLNIAKTLMYRMRNIIKDYKDFDFEEEASHKIVVNGCTIEAFPANHIDSFRGLANLKFIFLDEADFFRKGGEEYGKEVRTVTERYIAKSRPWIVMVSTPNRPDGLFAQIEAEPEEECLYYRIPLDYTRGLGYIYTEEDIKEARKSDSFAQEYELKYAGKIGNTFTTEQIERALELGRELRVENPDLKARPTRLRCWGIDPGGGSSKSALVIAELNKDTNTIDIIHSVEYDRTWSPSTIADDVFQLFLECGEIKENNKIYIDGARPDFINEVKIRFGERTDWLKPEDINVREDSIIPVNFSVHNKKMLSNLHGLLSNGVVRLPESVNEEEKFDYIATALRTAWSKEWSLDKNETVHDDHLDALRLALHGISIEEEN